MNPPVRIILPVAVILAVLGIWHSHQSVPATGSGCASVSLPQAAGQLAAPSRGGLLPAPGQPDPSSPAEGLNDADWQSISSQIAVADRAFVSPAGSPGVYKAFNRARNLAFGVSANAIEVSPREGPTAGGGRDSDSDPSWFVRLGLASSAPQAHPVCSGGNRLEIARDEWVEWYVHREDGLEQGFTIENPLAGQPLDRIAINLAIDTSLTPSQVTDSGAIRFLDASGQAFLSYEKLHAFDAEGRELPSQMLLVSTDATASQGSIRLEVDTTGATYPVVIDPLLTGQPLTLQEDTVNVTDMGASADQKRAVALDGNTLAVGEVWYNPLVAGPEGAVQIFYRQGDGSWQFLKRIQPTLVQQGDYFGSSVDLDGDTLIVGNRSEPGSNLGDGAFIFTRNEGGADNWGEVQVEGMWIGLQPSDPNTLGFGNAVAIRGDWAFVGCQRGEFNTPTGRVYLYYRNQGGTDNWGQIQRILAPSPEGYDYFGSSVAVSPNGEFLIVGAPLTGVAEPSPGAAHLYAAEAGVFIHVAELSPPSSSLEGFGSKVAISDTSIAVTAAADGDDPDLIGGVYVYDYSRTFLPGPGYVYDVSAPQELRPPEGAAYKTFGHSLGFNTTYLCIGQDEAKVGSVYQQEPFFFYQRDPGTQLWGLSRVMYDPQTTSTSEFGSSFALTETHLAVAAPSNKEVQIYALDGGAGDHLGSAVCVEGDTIIVGADRADGPAVESGAAYVFSRQAGHPEAWVLQHKIMADDGATGDQFGSSASLSGDIVVIGAPEDDDHGGSSGAAYAFDRDLGGTGNWGKIQKFAPTDTAAGDRFGSSVAIWLNRVVVGAPTHDAFGLDEGTAYIYESGAFKTKLDGFLAGPGDHFGFSVSIYEDFVIVGAPYNDFNAGVSNAGLAIVFKHDPSSGNWPEYSTLGHVDPEVDDHFGWSVAINGANALVGAPFRNVGGKVDAGAAYLFLAVDPLVSAADKILVPLDPDQEDQFGSAVALQGNRAVVGSTGNYLSASVSYAYPGAAYIYDADTGGAGNWGQSMKRVPPDGQPRDIFGYAVALDGDTIVVGAPFHDGPQPDSGAAYFFDYDPNDIDADGDGLTVAQEGALGTSDNDPDSDDDGYPDGVEYYCMGTNPADPDSGPYHLSVDVSPPSVILSWQSVAGITYVIEQSATLQPDSWIEVPGSQVVATGSVTTRVIAIDPASATQMFYRVAIPNCQVPPP